MLMRNNSEYWWTWRMLHYTVHGRRMWWTKLRISFLISRRQSPGYGWFPIPTISGWIFYLWHSIGRLAHCWLQELATLYLSESTLVFTYTLHQGKKGGSWLSVRIDQNSIHNIVLQSARNPLSYIFSSLMTTHKTWTNCHQQGVSLETSQAGHLEMPKNNSIKSCTHYSYYALGFLADNPHFHNKICFKPFWLVRKGCCHPMRQFQFNY